MFNRMFNLNQPFYVPFFILFFGLDIFKGFLVLLDGVFDLTGTFKECMFDATLLRDFCLVFVLRCSSKISFLKLSLTFFWRVLCEFPIFLLASADREED